MEAFQGVVGGMKMRTHSQFLRPCLTAMVSLSHCLNTVSSRSCGGNAFTRRTSCSGKYADSTFWDAKKLHPSLCTRKSLQGKKHIVPSFKVLASQYESVLPLPRDEEVASLEHLLEAPSADQSELPATPREQGAKRVEAIIERVIFDCRFLALMAVMGSLAGSILCFFKVKSHVSIWMEINLHLTKGNIFFCGLVRGTSSDKCKLINTETVPCQWAYLWTQILSPVARHDT
jgi:hypothetical protein